MGTDAAYLAPAIPAGAAFLIVLFGRRLPRLAPYVSIAAVAAALGVFVYVLLAFLADGAGSAGIEWFDPGWLARSPFRWDTTVDELSVVMLGLVSFVALGIQIYSLEYMHGEDRLWWYFAVHSLFVAAMLALVLAGNLLLLYLAWELVGLGSYLLIGFWWERKAPAEAAKKAFITTRIGDVGLLIGIALLFRETGTFDIATIIEMARAGLIDGDTLRWAMILIFAGAAGKSAQVPLHVWLPDAMEGPTPVSALIHAATMVVAGVYLVARLFPLFALVPAAMDLVAIIGLLTALTAGATALVMTDLKRILAYSTVSHLGFMMLALGAGAPGVAVFHLVAHAFSKAVLFLGAGSIAHGTGATNIRDMGGLRRRMPLTTITFSIGALSLAGLPPLSGFFSKDEIIENVLHGRLNDVFLVLTFVAVALSVLYTGRMLYRVFLGPLRPENEDAHEPGVRMMGPIVVFSVLAAGLGALAFNWGADYRGFAEYLVASQAARGWFPEAEHGFEFNWALVAVSVAVVAAGLYLTWLMYVSRRVSAARVRRAFGPLPAALEERLYFDHVYQWAIDNAVLVLAKVTAWFDRAFINDIGVDGPAKGTRWTGAVARYLHTGLLYNYGLAMVIGAIVLSLLWLSLQAIGG